MPGFPSPEAKCSGHLHAELGTMITEEEKNERAILYNLPKLPKCLQFHCFGFVRTFTTLKAQLIFTTITRVFRIGLTVLKPLIARIFVNSNADLNATRRPYPLYLCTSSFSFRIVIGPRSKALSLKIVKIFAVGTDLL